LGRRPEVDITFSSLLRGDGIGILAKTTVF
jgi:hypothetical protein